MFDVSSRKSFEALDVWLREAAKFGAGKFPCVLCGNKIDQKRVISEEEARQYAKIKGFEYFETSACTGANVQDAFMRLFELVLNQMSQ
jgi:GTPase SAR1 family protein